jgi:hypothetical protein
MVCPIIQQGVSASPIIKQGVSASPIIIKQGVSAIPIIKQGVSASPIISMCNLCLTSAIFVSYPCVPHIQLATYPHCIVSKGIIMVNVWLKRGRISFSSLQSAAHNCVSILIAICSLIVLIDSLRPHRPAASSSCSPSSCSPFKGLMRSYASS